MRISVAARMAVAAVSVFFTVGLNVQAAEAGGHASINPATWAPTTAGAYFFDRSNPDLPANYVRRESEFGRKFDGHLYYLPANVTQGDLAGAHWSLAVDHVPFVVLSWATGNNPNTIIPGIAAGRYNSDIISFAKAVKAQLSPYGHVLIRPFWEFNYTGSEWNDVHYGHNPKIFIAAWRHFVNIFRSNGVYNVKWLWNPIRVASSQSQNPVPYYPGSSYVDWIGIDAYPKNIWMTLQQLATTSRGGSNFDWYDTFKRYGKPLMFGEVGILPANRYPGGAPSRATWWYDALSELRNRLTAVRAIEYFDSSTNFNWKYDAPGTRAGDSGAQALQAARTVTRNCYLDVLSASCGGITSRTPTPTPTPTPAPSPTSSRHPTSNRHPSSSHHLSPSRSPLHSANPTSGGGSAGHIVGVGASPAAWTSHIRSHQRPAMNVSALDVVLSAIVLGLLIPGTLFGWRRIRSR
jgi:glycosyl hydrolase family 26